MREGESNKACIERKRGFNMKFKVGDKVRIKSKEELERIKDFTCSLNNRMKEYAGDMVEITSIDKTYNGKEFVRIKENGWAWDIRAIEEIIVTKQELLSMPIGTKIITDAEDEDYRIWIKIDDKFANNYDTDCRIDDYDINDDLTLDVDSDFGLRIVKIEKPTYETVYEMHEIKEMTIAEIEKALGHPVKIIKED